PWANLPVTLLMFGFFGWRAAYLIVGAMLIALITGAVFTILDRHGWIEGPIPGGRVDAAAGQQHPDMGAGAALAGIGNGALRLANMVLWWILIGILIAALIGAYVPAHLFVQYLGPDLQGMFMTLLAATIMEVCSEGTAPIAFEIFDKTGSL
ncbi:MAG: hypothetical protein KJO82_01930, partial [Gammaproteobacteria bacterium]|nr:hypothetical protein [Gammaproteobacteria bacterium]